MDGEQAGPLQGLVVLDFSSMMAGPYCGRWLHDAGADVVKIEPPEGDFMRGRPPMRGDTSAYFGHLNAGKRSLCLDLKRPEALEAARRLAARADVLIENFRPGVMKRLGLGFEALQALNPRLIYCSISGYGQSGPDHAKPGYAALVHAESGFDEAWRQAQAGQETPSTCAIQIADVVAASFAVMAIQNALLARHRSGRGQQIDLSLLEGMLTLMPLEIVQAQHPGDSRRAYYRPVRTLDGHVVITPITGKGFVDMCKAMGRAELATDPRFERTIDRVENWDSLMGLVSQWAATRTTAEVLELMQREQVPAASYPTVAEVLGNAQLAHREFFQRATDAQGDYAIAGLPYRLGAAPRRAMSAVPTLGEHTREVLAGLAGLGEREIDNILRPEPAQVSA